MLQHRIILHSELFVLSRGEVGGLTTFKFLLKKKNSLWSFTSELCFPFTCYQSIFFHVANKQTQIKFTLVLKLNKRQHNSRDLPGVSSHLKKIKSNYFFFSFLHFTVFISFSLKMNKSVSRKMVLHLQVCSFSWI